MRLIPLAFLMSTLMLVGCGGGGGEEETVDSIGLTQGRWGHTSTLLQDGRVLIVGGQQTPGTQRDSAEIYGLDGTLSSAGSMSEKRGEGHTATLLTDGRVLVVGGGLSGSNSVELFDPSSDQWSSTGSMGTERIEHTATLLKDGKVLVAGGLAGRRNLNSSEIYDPSTGQWLPASKMDERRQSHKAALLQDGTVLVSGKSSSEIYDQSTDSWSLTGEMVPGKDRYGEGRLGGATLTVLQDGRALLSAGAVTAGEYEESLRDIKQAEIYDPSTGLWSAASDLLEARKFHTATLMPDGKVLLIGDKTAELYDPKANTWTSAGTLNLPRFEWHTATLLPNGTVLVVGGKASTSTTKNRSDTSTSDKARDIEGMTAVEIYDPATGWQLLDKTATASD